ncbi:GNAT family N-acetyltransferase [Candidatus Soleaferrea massiliensis]|uniref:GNAT family N-acetyltransferase n=1 Tax=Candidatus Soleaferrea massiliensis TaxID=1470354 RepID=UPI00058C4F7D|nr:GNAT family N-acetyltransferase [Candidatus Soleaferrea massiliensis]
MDFILRRWKEEDIESVARFANNPRIAENLRDAFPYPYTIQDARMYVRSCVEEDETRQCCRAIEADGKAVGSIGIFLKEDVYRRSAELGYWLAEPYWNKGIMSAAVKQLCDEAFRKYDIVRIFAEPYAHNAGSRKVLEHAGFILEGILKNSVCKYGKMFDSCIYALCKTE